MGAEIPTDIQFKIDAIASNFESNWQLGNHIKIGSLLDQIEPHFRNELLQELLRVDVELKRNGGHAVSADEYQHLGEEAVECVARLLSSREEEHTIPPQKLIVEEAEVEREPTQIGPYKLLQKIGEGGMGAVWMAQQEKPVKRRVALKLIKPELASDEFIARFEAERQALSMMDHPNIARVLDAGTSEQGEPYFVMELIKGVPINKYCDQNKLNIDERLELFVPVCKAVQHAHQKGVLHRDLKPNNVLVTLYDGKPVAKVIDFGLAKAIDHTHQLTDKTMFTEFGKVVGTLQYMSPEQAEMSALDVDTRTDIYSLGVMLYELLTGSPPLDRQTLGQNALLQVLALIRETEPPRPSDRLSSSGDLITGISEQRQIAPTRLRQILRGELDWVVMKALEKDRTRRYETASGFADDIERYLTNDPVLARPLQQVIESVNSFARIKAWLRRQRSHFYW